MKHSLDIKRENLKFIEFKEKQETYYEHKMKDQIIRLIVEMMKKNILQW